MSFLRITLDKPVLPRKLLFSSSVDLPLNWGKLAHDQFLMLALERQRITFRLCVYREGKPLNLLRLTEEDQSKYCLHIKLFKPRIILNSTWAKHFLPQRNAFDTQPPSSHGVLAQWTGSDRVKVWLPVLQCRLSTRMNKTCPVQPQGGMSVDQGGFKNLPYPLPELSHIAMWPSVFYRYDLHV